MGLKLRLVEDGKILFEIPISPEDWVGDDLRHECHRFVEEVEEISKVFDAFTNDKRVRMMRSLLEDDDFMLSFNDFLKDLNMNPKSVREHAERLSEAGFLEHPDRGKYRLSELGRRRFITAGLALRRILQFLDDYEW
ncbi:MAG: winged helix-turn-helix domain-containing protein [Candidatus Geothermarchaeales archaeon]